MARRKRTNSRESADSQRGGPGGAQQSTFLAEAIATRAVPDHELSVLGVSNNTRHFLLEDPSNGPSCVFRLVFPMANYVYGFSAAGDRSSQDVLSAIDTTVSDPTSTLYPILNYPIQVEKHLWPVLNNLFSSGTGARYNISVSEFTRYQAMMLRAYYELLNVMQINSLAYHFDWTKVFPFSDTTPSYIYDMAQLYDATDIGLAQRWLPLMKRMNSLVAFPRVIAEIKRIMAPTYSVDFNARLQVPLTDNPLEWTETGTTADIKEAYVKSLLDYIEVDLASASATIQSFIPFPMAASDPWVVQTAPTIDIDRDSGLFNSTCKVEDFPRTFGDTGDPQIREALVFYGRPTPQPVVYYSRHSQPTWAEVRMCTIYEEFFGVGDDEFELVTPHLWSAADIPADDDSFFRYQSWQVGTQSLGFRYIDFANSRFASQDVDWGTMKPGFMGSMITVDAVRRLADLDCDYLFSTSLMKGIMTEMTGASLRELKLTIHQAVFSGTQGSD